MVWTWRFHCQDLGSIPGWGTNISQDAQLRHLKKKKNKKSSIVVSRDITVNC